MNNKKQSANISHVCLSVCLFRFSASDIHLGSLLSVAIQVSSLWLARIGLTEERREREGGTRMCDITSAFPGTVFCDVPDCLFRSRAMCIYVCACVLEAVSCIQLLNFSLSISRLNFVITTCVIPPRSFPLLPPFPPPLLHSFHLPSLPLFTLTSV